MNGQSRLQPLARAVLRTQSDERLVALIRGGRDSAFDEIARRYRPALVAFAAAYAPGEAAEDVVQESLAAAWRAIRDTSTEIQLKPWLYTIVRNRALNASRDARPHEQLEEHVDAVPRPDEVVLTREELDRVVAAVGALPAMQRQALVRSALEGRTHEQIAAELGSSVGGVAQLIFRARTAVRSGVGLVIPLPIVRALLEPAGQAATGAAGAGAAAAGAGGGGLIAKGAAVALIGVAAAGSGIALHDSKKPDNQADAASVRSDPPDGTGTSADGSTTAGGPEFADVRGGEAEPGDDRGRGAEPGDDHGSGESSGPGGGESSGPGGGGGGGHGFNGESSGPGGAGESSGPGGGESSGPSAGVSGPGFGESSGPGGGDNSGHDSGNSGPGGGDDGHSGSSGPSPEVEEMTTPTTTTTTTTTTTESLSGSGSGSSGSGSFGSGSLSSGSGTSGSGGGGPGTD
jgi:RNA polymerase sigma factor (sigma-70 family)